MGLILSFVCAQLRRDIGIAIRYLTFAGPPPSLTSFDQLMHEEHGCVFSALLRIYSESIESGYMSHAQVFPRRSSEPTDDVHSRGSGLALQFW